ncbi:TetR/AcrR family transcriptional regulator [Tomitella biformata]|uniref:TetR/AcrR family transcriptional regulator n=1 Tax=Tomitella biformata TaxID=630403 RepID=UPI000466F609|nr:TetR/AcrR family transcriptional regulator [Tomitella biformata]
MARNDERRARLTDAGLELLADEGARGLTHRGIDKAAGVPAGTTSNYFATRDALVAGLVERIGERLAPRPEVLRELAGREPTRELFAAYMRDIVTRLLGNRKVAVALYELRLEATRRPEIAKVMGDWQREAFAADVAFNDAAGLPGGRREVALFHYAIEGLLFDRLTTPIDEGTPTDEIIDDLVAGLLPG